MTFRSASGQGSWWAGLRSWLFGAGVGASLAIAILLLIEERRTSPAPVAPATAPPADAGSRVAAPPSEAAAARVPAAPAIAAAPSDGQPRSRRAADPPGQLAVTGDPDGAGESISAAFPFESHYLNVNGYRLHYIDEGAGDPLIFLHGNPAWSYLWRNVIPHLSPQARCIAPDMIGMGLSEKPPLGQGYTYHFHLANLERFLDALDLDGFTLVVHDWGSTLGCSLALRNPGRVRGLAISEMLGIPEAIGPPAPWNITATNLCLAYLDEQVGAKLVLEMDSFIDPFLTNLLVKRRLSPEEVAWYRKPYQRPEDRMAMWRWPSQIPNWPAGRTPDGRAGSPEVAEEFRRVGEFLRTTPIPKLLFYSSEGNSSPHTAKYFRDHFPNVETYDLGDGRHYVQEENPHAMGRELARWFRALPP